jgi:hypothetical protein
MGCDVALPDGVPTDDVHTLFERRDRRFSRFIASSEINRVNETPRGLMSLSEEFASMLTLALDAARATGGLVTPAVGCSAPRVRLRPRLRQAASVRSRGRVGAGAVDRFDLADRAVPPPH